MIDVHCHILPGIDDGAKSLEESISMAEIAVRSGTRHIISTSHYNHQSEKSQFERVLAACKELNDVLISKGIDLTVHAGNELYYTEELVNELDGRNFHTLAKSRYVLVEFSPDNMPFDMEGVAYEFTVRGYVPVIAHVERYGEVSVDEGTVQRLIEYGFLIQMNAGSIYSGGRTKRLCRSLLKRGQVHFIGSDAHDCRVRTPDMKTAYLKCKRFLPKDLLNKIFFENPQSILGDRHEVMKLFFDGAKQK